MTKQTFKYLWKNVIVKQAEEVLQNDDISVNLKKFNQKKDDIKNEYDNLRGYSKFAYLKDPDGLSNRYLVSTYIILAIAKIKPLNAGKNEGTFKNEKLAIRVGLWVLCLFKEYQTPLKKDKGLWDKDKLSDLLAYLGDFEELLYYHLYYDISDRIYSILEMSNILWIIESYIDIVNKLDNKGKKDAQEQLNNLNRDRRNTNEWLRKLDLRWDTVWRETISDAAVEIVEKNKGRTEFDRTSKYIILNEYLTLLNESKDNYAKLSGVPLDKYMVVACFILSIAKSQPLRYKYDIHAKKGIYNENLAIESGLRLLYQFGISCETSDFNNSPNAFFTLDSTSADSTASDSGICDSNLRKQPSTVVTYRNDSLQRFVFPKSFHNRTYKELLCLMLHYDIRENKYSILAIANILFMIKTYTDLNNNYRAILDGIADYETKILILEETKGDAMQQVLEELRKNKLCRLFWDEKIENDLNQPVELSYEPVGEMGVFLKKFIFTLQYKGDDDRFKGTSAELEITITALEAVCEEKASVKNDECFYNIKMTVYKGQERKIITEYRLFEGDEPVYKGTESDLRLFLSE